MAGKNLFKVVIILILETLMSTASTWPYTYVYFPSLKTTEAAEVGFKSEKRCEYDLPITSLVSNSLIISCPLCHLIFLIACKWTCLLISSTFDFQFFVDPDTFANIWQTDIENPPLNIQREIQALIHILAA